MNETELVKRIRLAFGKDPDVVSWHNSTGVHAVADPRTERVRRVRYGLCKGSADVVCIVAPYGRWLALEVKTKVGRVRDEQPLFLALVEKMGGVGRIVRSVDEAMAALDEAKYFKPTAKG